MPSVSLALLKTPLKRRPDIATAERRMGGGQRTDWNAPVSLRSDRLNLAAVVALEGSSLLNRLNLRSRLEAVDEVGLKYSSIAEDVDVSRSR